MFTRRNLLRLVLFVLCALAAAGLIPEAWRRGSVLLPGLSPLLSLGGALAARAAGVLTLLGLPLLILPLFAGRFFCWRLCPMGFAAETVSRINRRNTGWIRKIPFVGKGLALLILGSAAAGWPVLIWTDPLSVFNGFFAAARQPLTWLSAATASGFILILLASLIVPNLWCHRLCPLGGLQEWLSQLGKSLRSARCAKEGDEIPPLLTHARTGRRVFLGFALGGVSGSLYRAYGPRRVTTDTDCGGTHSCGGRHGHGPGEGEAGQRRRMGRGSGAGLPIRPPGAVQQAFNALCARCGNCMTACPYGLILPDLGTTGPDGLFTPVLAFRNLNPQQEQFCFQECTACTQACPTGALRPLTVARKQQTAIGLAHICRNKCIAWKKGEYCVVCQEFCPYQAIREVERNGVMCPIVDADKCRGCGACESQCPALPIAVTIRGRDPQTVLAHPSPALHT
jgi:ferredoxin